jgi:hypothetical protein
MIHRTHVKDEPPNPSELPIVCLGEKSVRSIVKEQLPGFACEQGRKEASGARQIPNQRRVR